VCVSRDEYECEGKARESEALKESAESQGSVCDSSLIANNYCDRACYNEKYNYDGGDCCPSDWIGDGTCDDACNLEKLNFDGGDCI